MTRQTSIALAAPTTHEAPTPKTGLWRAAVLSVAALPFASLLTGCGSTKDLRGGFADQLDACHARIDASNILEGHEQLVDVISQLDAIPENDDLMADYARQRLVAEAMLVALHANANAASGSSRNRAASPSTPVHRDPRTFGPPSRPIASPPSITRGASTNGRPSSRPS